MIRRLIRKTQRAAGNAVEWLLWRSETHSVKRICRYNKMANTAIRVKNYNEAERWLLRLHRAEILDGVRVGTYRFRQIY